MTPKLRRCDEATIAGRLRKAEQFMDAAETIRELADEGDDVGDAYVTLCVHAGVAAADVLCCVALANMPMATITTRPSRISPRCAPVDGTSATHCAPCSA